MKKILFGVFVFTTFYSLISTHCFSAENFTKVSVYGGEVNEIALCASNPSVMYACGCYGGLWVSKDAGETWTTTTFYETPLSDKSNVSGIVGGATHLVVHPTLPNIVIASQFGSFGNKVFRSEDYGQTWEETGNSEIYSNNINVRKIVASRKTAGTFYLVGNSNITNTGTDPNSDGVVYKSVDAGLTWTKTSFTSSNTSAWDSSSKAAWDMCVDANDVIYVTVVNAPLTPDIKDTGSAGWLYKSSDGGSTWTKIKTLNTAPVYLSISANTLAINGSGSESGIYISSDGGTSFVYKSGGCGPIVVSTDGYKIYGFWSSRVNISSYTGSSWSNFWSDFVAVSTGTLDGTRGYSISSVLIDPANPNNVYASEAYQDAFLKSTDTAVTWRVSNKGLGGLIVYDGCKDPAGNIYVLGRMDVFKSADSGVTWNEVFEAPADFEKGVIAAPQTNYAYASAYGKIWRTIDGGATWSEVLSIGSNYGTANKIVFNKNNSAIGYAAFNDANPIGATSSKYIYKTTNSGATWTQLDLTGYSVQSLAIDPNDPTILYAGLGDLHPTENTKYYSYGGLWKIIDNGSSVSWSKIALDGYIPYRIALDSNSVIIVSCIDQNDPTPYKYDRPTYFSTDGGVTWNEVGIGGETVAPMDIEYSDGLYYLASEYGIYVSRFINATFTIIAEKKDLGSVRCLIVGSMYAGANRGLYKLNQTATLTHTIEKPKLYAFPNPFSPKKGGGGTTLKYLIPQGKSITSVKISVYNIAGELVFETTDETGLTGGNAYYYVWDGLNQSGEECAEGVYILVFDSNLDTAKTKIVLYRK
ncbi:MAG: hypothetical protein HY919_01550 [Elusimicrobia bacterium]|nr:hypothetical protein [Elusimicrobiota bacterium]